MATNNKPNTGAPPADTPESSPPASRKFRVLSNCGDKEGNLLQAGDYAPESLLADAQRLLDLGAIEEVTAAPAPTGADGHPSKDDPPKP